MKKTLIILSTLLVFLYSCKDKENILELDIPKTDPESKIADLENSGIKLFKRNLKIADATGDNFVIVQVASENESTLNNYLQGTTFRLTLGDVFQKIDNIQSSTSTNIKPSTDNIDIYDVVLFKKIDSKYKSYTIKYQHSTQKNARIKDVNNYTKNTWHESNRFDDWMNVTWFSVGASEEVLTLIWKHLNCALCSWDTDDYVGLYAGNQSSTHSPDARRLGCRVHHNFYNYNVTYGNY
jgi:hypothetical protein